jgi:hypothetical protein
VQERTLSDALRHWQLRTVAARQTTLEQEVTALNVQIRASKKHVAEMKRKMLQANT